MKGTVMDLNRAVGMEMEGCDIREFGGSGRGSWRL